MNFEVNILLPLCPKLWSSIFRGLTHDVFTLLSFPRHFVYTKPSFDDPFVYNIHCCQSPTMDALDLRSGLRL